MNLKNSRQFLSYIAPFLVFIGTCALFVQASSHRAFWTDEIFGFQVLDQSFWHLLVHGPRDQCSRSPLFYLINKLFFPAGTPLNTMAQQTLLRLPSTLVAGLFLALITATSKSGRLVGLLAAGYIFQDAVFLTHATESRPYIVWLLVTFFLAKSFLDRFLEKNPPLSSYLIVTFLASILALLATTSMFLFCGILFWYLLFQRNQLLKMSLFLAPAFVIGIYYALGPQCYDHASGDGVRFNFLYNWKNGEYGLLNAVIKLLISPKSILDIPVNMSLLVFFGLWLKRPPLFRSEAKKISFLLVTFVTAAILTGIAVAIRNYYFVPRLFIYLLTARALIIIIIFSALYNYALERGLKQPKYQYLFYGGCSLFILFTIYRAISFYQ